MTPDLHAMLLDWLANGDDLHRRHAEHRLSMPDAIGYVSPPAVPGAKPEVRMVESDMVRAARLIRENPPDGRGKTCGPC